MRAPDQRDFASVQVKLEHNTPLTEWTTEELMVLTSLALKILSISDNMEQNPAADSGLAIGSTMIVEALNEVFKRLPELRASWTESAVLLNGIALDHAAGHHNHTGSVRPSGGPSDLSAFERGWN